MTGKWNLGHEPQHSPTAHGFDSSFALVRAGDNHLGASNYPDELVAYRENGVPVEKLPDGWFSSELYRAVKGSLHEGGTLAAAFVFDGSGSVAEPGGIDHDYLSVMDVMPTLLEIAGRRHPGTEFQGQSVLPIRGRSFWPRVGGDTAPVHGETDIIPWMTSDRRGALVRGNFKVKKDDADPSIWRLYDLDKDPGEMRDLSEELPELKAELVTAWTAYADGL